MSDLTAFKNEIMRYGIIIMAIFELTSLPFLGWDEQFFYGLLIGTAITIGNFYLMEITLRLTLTRRNVLISYFGYLVRLAIFGGAFYVTVSVSLVCGLATVLGFFTLKLAMFYIHGIKAKFSKGRVLRDEPKDIRVKNPWYDFREDDDDEDK